MNSQHPSRREIVEAFRTRLEHTVAASGRSRSAFAARAGIDRSTLSQLLAPGLTRLPRAETVAALARSGGVSADWLLGLSESGAAGTDVLAESVAIEAGAASPADARLERWHAEAIGYKIRYVPATLPDLFKTGAVIAHEFELRGTISPAGRAEQAEARLAYTRRPETDMEICAPVQSLEGFARGEGIWRSLPAAARRAQLETMASLLDELYPTVRWFLYDGRERFSAPLTVFGPLRAALYVGDMYLVLTATEHVRALTRHFDGLIRAAVDQPRDVVRRIERLLGEPGLRRPASPAPR